MTSPLGYRMCSPPYRRGLISPYYFFFDWFAEESFLPSPRYTRGMPQVLEPFLPPPATLAARGRILTGEICLLYGLRFLPLVFFACFWLHILTVRGVEEGFEEPHPRLMVEFVESEFPEPAIFLHMRLIRVG